MDVLIGPMPLQLIERRNYPSRHFLEHISPVRLSPRMQKSYSIRNMESVRRADSYATINRPDVCENASPTGRWGRDCARCSIRGPDRRGAWVTYPTLVDLAGPTKRAARTLCRKPVFRSLSWNARPALCSSQEVTYVTQLAGHTVVVTGAATGIGRAIALKFGRGPRPNPNKVSSTTRGRN